VKPSKYQGKTIWPLKTLNAYMSILNKIQSSQIKDIVLR
jgi:hypothetical protein